MNRLPRRRKRFQPPLRGRLAANLALRQQQDHSLPELRSRPTMGYKSPQKIINCEQDELSKDLSSLQPSGQELLTVEQNSVPTPAPPQPKPQLKLGQWLLGLVILLILLVLIGNLF
ncbi:MAG: hypothetical protein AAFY63_07530 [Cyanobacteria bacterium J06643_13]